MAIGRKPMGKGVLALKSVVPAQRKVIVIQFFYAIAAEVIDEARFFITCNHLTYGKFLLAKVALGHLIFLFPLSCFTVH